MSREKVGLFIDQANINANGGFNMDYTVLKDFVLRGGARAVHLNIYSSLDPAKVERDPGLAGRVQGYQTAVRALGYHLSVKPAKHFEEGDRVFIKSNVDIDIAVDVLESAANLDRIVLLTGDGDFAPMIRAARRKGARVEVIAMDNCSAELRESADAVFNGWLIPGLVPLSADKSKVNSLWGQPGSRVRGTIDNVDTENKTITIRYMKPWLNASDTVLLAPMAPSAQGVAICDIGVIERSDPSGVRGSIVEFSLQGLMDDIGAAQEVELFRFATRSGWYRPWLS